MDQKTQQAFEGFKNAQTQLLASFTLLTAALSAHQRVIEKVCQQCGIASLEGKAIPLWIQEQVQEAVQQQLLQCKDEQLAAEIQARLRRPRQY